MGSFVADSNSIVVSVFSFSLSCLDSRIEKTAAASVDDTTAPSKIDLSQLLLGFYLYRLYLPDLFTVLSHGAIRREKAAARRIEYGHASP